MKTIYGVLFVSAVLALSTAKEALIWDALRDLDDASDVDFESLKKKMQCSLCC